MRSAGGAEERGGRSATVRGTTSDEAAGVLRIDFVDQGAEEELDEIGWDEFFDKFEENRLAFLYQDEMSSGETSRFNKFVRRDD